MMDGCTDGRFCLTSVQLFEIRGQSAFPRVAVSHDKEFCMASVGRARVVLSCELRGELPRGSSFRCKPSLRRSPTNMRDLIDTFIGQWFHSTPNAS